MSSLTATRKRLVPAIRLKSKTAWFSRVSVALLLVLALALQGYVAFAHTHPEGDHEGGGIHISPAQSAFLHTSHNLAPPGSPEKSISPEKPISPEKEVKSCPFCATVQRVAKAYLPVPHLLVSPASRPLYRFSPSPGDIALAFLADFNWQVRAPPPSA